MCTRYGGAVTRVDSEWGRAIDPAAVEAALSKGSFDLVAIVHAETSTGVRNPVPEVATLAHAHGALVLVDAVTSLGGQALDMAAWGIDACYSGTQKCIGAPSGLAPVAFAPSALARRVKCRSFYLDLSLLEDYWVRRKYHHTMSASLVYAFDEALAQSVVGGRAGRVAATRALRVAMTSLGLGFLVPARRLMTSTPCASAGVDDGGADGFAEEQHRIGGGMGPLGKIWRIGDGRRRWRSVDVLVAASGPCARDNCSHSWQNGPCPRLRTIEIMARRPSSSVVTIPSICCS